MYSYAALIRSQPQMYKPKKPKPSSDQPLDADDLSRRLSAHLSAQEKASRRAAGGRRRLHLRLRPLSMSSSSAPVPAPDQGSPPPYEAAPAPYHHAPVVAATSFTPDRGRRERQVRSERSPGYWGAGGDVSGLGKREKGAGRGSRLVRVLGLGKRRKVDGDGDGDGGKSLGNGIENESAEGAVPVPAPVPVAESDLELKRFASSREEGGRGSQRASFLARLKWHPSHGS